MPSVAHRADDEELTRRVAAGDRDAFTAIDDRHRKALVRYAGTLLRRSEHDAQDVVQDVLIRAHEALLAGEAPDRLRPWLYRLTRNRAIDEVRRARWGDESLDDESLLAGDLHGSPDAVLRRREAVRRIVEDLAGLPVRQRVALLARELDGQSPQDVAAQLGVSVDAAQKLATRARENLLKARDARDADCGDVRHALLTAHERGVRPSDHALRHVTGCGACRAYRRDSRRLSRQLRALNPAFGLPLVAAVANLFGGGATTSAVSAALAVAVIAGGGVVVLRSDVFEPGDPAPFRLQGVRDAQGGPVTTGEPVPGGNVVVTTRVHVPAGAPSAGQARSVTLPCPAGMRYAHAIVPEQAFPAMSARVLGPGETSLPGYSTRAQILFETKVARRAADFTLGIVCRRPDANGSVVEHPRPLRHGERRGRVCARTFEYVVRPPGPVGRSIPVTRVYRGEPVAVQRRTRSGRWTRIATDLGTVGWVKTSALCP